MSDSNPVTWRLNDLLEAGKKAKAFASSPMQKDASSIDDKNFSLTSYDLTKELDDLSSEPSAIQPNIEENITGSSEEDPEELEAPEHPDTIVPDRPTEEDHQRMIEESEVFKKRIEQAREEGLKEGLVKGAEDANKELENSIQLQLRIIIKKLIQEPK